jgi:signal transduction histidine kinase
MWLRSRAGGSTPLDASTRERILSVRLDEQYGRLPVALAAVFANAVLVGLLLRPRAGSGALAWAAAVCALTLVRLAGWTVHRRRRPALPVRAWYALHVTGAVVNGALWGALPLLIFRGQGEAEHLIIAATMVGMVAGSASSALGSPSAFAAFAIPALTPLVIRLLEAGGPLETAAAFLACVFAAAMGFLARNAWRTLTVGLVHQLRNEALIADLSRTSEELTEVNAGLEERIRERSDELLELEHELSQSTLLASVGSLAAAVAHDINNPLASLITNLRQVQQELAASPELETATLREALGDVQACADRVRTIVRSLSEVARQDGARGPLDLGEIVESCLAVAAPELRNRVRVVREHVAPCRVMAERASLSQVLLTLILHLGRSIPEGQPDAHELHVTTKLTQGDRVAAVQLSTSSSAAPGTARPGATSQLLLSLSHAAVARVGGSIFGSAGGNGFVVTFPAEPWRASGTRDG